MPLYYYDIIVQSSNFRRLEHRIKITAYSPIEAVYLFFVRHSRFTPNLSKRTISYLSSIILYNKINVIEYRMSLSRGWLNVRYVKIHNYSTPQLIELLHNYFNSKKKIRFK